MENTQTRDTLVQLCKNRGIKGYSGKKKAELILMIQQSEEAEKSQEAEEKKESQEAEEQEENGALYRMIDLFAGTGAFSHAFHEVSQGTVRGVFANDMVERSKIIYDVNHHHPLTLQDLNEVKVEDIPPHDILTGGFPCQPFSIAGKQEGFQDRRSNVFWKILEILDFHRPACIVLENVKNLVSHDKGNTFQVIRTRLEERGYHLHYKVLNTAEITGIPQHRERIYIVGLRSKSAHDAFAMDFPVIEKQPIQRLLDQDVPDKYYYTADTEAGRMVREEVIRSDTVYQYRRVYVRENKSNECPTLTANMGAGGHNVPLVRDKKGVRKLTPRECFRFQGFPDSYTLPKMSDANLYQLAGNAVSVPVVRLIARRLLVLPLFG
jgi:DNA (cytosine-5)-methyltransferase 1